MTILYMVYQIKNGVNKLLSVCGSKDSLAKVILYLNELGYVDIKTKPFIQNESYENLFENNKTLTKKEDNE